MKVGLQKSNFPKISFMVLFVLFLAIFVAASAHILISFKPVFDEKAEHSAKQKAVSVLNTAITDAFDGINYDDFVEINTDERDKVSFVSTKSAEMNRLRSKILRTAMDYTHENDTETIYIPIGSITNFDVLQGVGYRVPIKISLDGISEIDFEDEFEDAGINQVKHKIYLTAVVTFSVVSAVMNKSGSTALKIPICETVIVGDVPQYYGDHIGVVGRE